METEVRDREVHDMGTEFATTGDENVLSDSLDIFGCIKMPPWLNTRSTSVLDTETDNVWT